MLLIFLSFLLLACAQPDISPLCCVLLSCFGFALFWRGLLNYSSWKTRFLLAFLWYATGVGIHLSWFTADRYVGSFIFLFLVLLLTVLGLSFALFSLLIKKDQKWITICGLASLWTIMEWSRLFLLSGFPWDPVGLNLSATLPGLQMASLAGVFGMSFWVIGSNLVSLKALTSFSRKNLLVATSTFILPYAFGLVQVAYHSYQMAHHDKPPLSVLLIQSALAPEEKTWLPQSKGPPLAPFVLWKHHLDLLKKHEGKEVDLIVFSEGAVPWGTHLPIYSRNQCEYLFPKEKGLKEKMTNAELSKLVAKESGADVVIGLEDCEKNCAHNSAFFCPVKESVLGRYEKRILVPMGEYIPFEWCKKILEKYGIKDSFTPGREAKIFQGKVPLGLSICYEEAYGHLMRENRLKGAELLVNLTNDVWYPHSRLAMVHYLHGRLRSVEMGIPLVRATNTGMTVGLDSLGRVQGILPHETRKERAPADSLHVILPSYTYKTLYTLTGDWGIIALSTCFSLLFLYQVLFGGPKRCAA